MKKSILISLSLALLPISTGALIGDYNPGGVGAGRPEVHITQDGIMSIKSAKVIQIVGTTFFLQLKWGQLPMSFVMKTDSKTAVRKRYGGTAEVSQIKLGDYLDGEGEFFVGSDFFGFNAEKVKNWSMQEESETFSGKIKEVNPDDLLLETPLGKMITVKPSSAASIMKGTIALPWSRMRAGDSIVLADGVYDYANNTLTAATIVLFQSKLEFAPRNYQGILKSANSTALPAILLVSVDGTDYTVQVPLGAAVLRKNRSPAILARFVAGDVVRFYGGLREAERELRDEFVVDAEVVRNINL